MSGTSPAEAEEQGRPISHRRGSDLISRLIDAIAAYAAGEIMLDSPRR
jgi:hypothetical protein